MVTALEQRIKSGKAKGEIPRDADPAILARYVATVIEGMSVQALNGADEATLLAIAKLALAVWPLLRSPARAAPSGERVRQESRAQPESRPRGRSRA